MLLRGRNTVGYTPYPEKVTRAFVQEATDTGIDIFRIFDALNNVDQMRPAIDAVRETGTALAEVALSYTGDLSDPNETLYTLDYYLKLAEEIDLVDGNSGTVFCGQFLQTRLPIQTRAEKRCASE